MILGGHPTLTEALASLPGRCEHGNHLATQGCGLCTPVAPNSEFAIFIAALRSAAGPDGLIHQTDVRPLIQAIPHKHRGTLYRKATAAGLIDAVGKEPSTDAAGKNLDKTQRVYRLRSAA
jgi:hypothetical protein